MNTHQFLTTTLHAAAQIAREHFGNVNPTVKLGDNNQVLTEADLAISTFIVDTITTEFPHHNLIDEEAGVIDNGSEYTWVIDPVEATSNFAAGSDEYGIMIGLLKSDLPIAGGIILPAKEDELYLGVDGKATKNGTAMRVNNDRQLIDSLISFGFDGDADDSPSTFANAEVFAKVSMACRNIRNSGCEAIDPMLVAQGVYGGRINHSARVWDLVASQAITQAAGAVWTDPSGKAIDYSDIRKIAEGNMAFCMGSPAVHQELIKIIS